MTRHISHTEANKLIRADLKKNFPGVKFSVRAGGGRTCSSTTITWEDGPDEKAVEKITNHYKGMAPDPGCSDYWDPRETTDANGERVSYGSDYISTSRRFSAGIMEAAEAKTAQLLGIPEVHDVNYTTDEHAAGLCAVEEFTGHRLHHGYGYGSTLIRYVAGRLAECAYLGVDADEEAENRRRQSDIESATWRAVYTATGSAERANEALAALTDPQADQVKQEKAAEYAEAQVGTAVPADEYAAAEAAADDDTARELLGEFLGELSTEYRAAFRVLDVTTKRPKH